VARRPFFRGARSPAKLSIARVYRVYERLRTRSMKKITTEYAAAKPCRQNGWNPSRYTYVIRMSVAPASRFTATVGRPWVIR